MSANDRPAHRTQDWRASPVGVGLFEKAYEHLLAPVDRVSKERHLIHGDLCRFDST